MKQTQMNTYSKREIRNYLSLLLNTGEKAFTLPSVGMGFEQLIKTQGKEILWTCMEYDSKRFKEIKNNCWEVGIPQNNVLFGNALDYLRTTSKNFNFVWLDLCSYFTANVFYHSLKCSLKGDVFACTFFMQRTKDFDLFKKIYKINTTEELLNKWVELVEFYSKKKLVKTFTYRNGDHCKMTTVVFKTKKKN